MYKGEFYFGLFSLLFIFICDKIIYNVNFGIFVFVKII